jgi:hypothetical protein
MSGLLKYLITNAAIKGGRKLAEGMEEEQEQELPPEQPPEPTPEQMTDPIQRAMYEEQMRKYLEWRRSQQPQQPQDTGLLNFEN